MKNKSEFGEILEKKIRAYALKNALAHDGKAQAKKVLSSLFSEGLSLSEVRAMSKKIGEIVEKVNKLSLDEQKREFEQLKSLVSQRETRQGLPDLPGVPASGIVTRFAPSPSGGLHIGHALTACIAFDYVLKYGGTFYVRVEDTNPDNIYPPAYDLIKEDSDWLFEGKAKFVIQSDRMEVYYKYAEQLLRLGVAYVCTCSPERFKKFSSEKKECPCRNLDTSENLQRWKRMLDKNGFRQGEAVLRFKSGMDDKNPAMRDFPLARINLTKHPRQKSKYRVWPLMNLAVAVDDIEMGMTHVIRAKDHRDNAKKQKKIYNALGKKYPWEAYLGRWKFKEFELSSTKITQGILEGKYSGWDDEQLPTLAALRKRGYSPQTFWKLAEHIGLSESDKVIEKEEFFKLLDAFNKE